MIKNFIEIIKRKPENILWHFAIGLMFALFTFFIFWLFSAGHWAIWSGFVAGCSVGLGVEGYQVIHIKWNLPLNDWLQESITDILEYIFGSAIILFMLIVF